MSEIQRVGIYPASTELCGSGAVCVIILNPVTTTQMKPPRDAEIGVGPGTTLDEQDMTRLINDLASRLTAWREDSLSLPDLVLKIMETHGGYSREFRAAQIAEVVKRRVLRDAHIAQEG